MNKRLVLASKSPRRAEIMKMVFGDFDIRVSDANENYDSSLPIDNVPQLLATRKARAVELSENEIVIGCDTVVIYENKLLGKPKDDDEAIKMLELLNGTAHRVISGLCVKSADKEYATSVITTVVFRHLEKEEIVKYVTACHPTDKAGAYGIQEMAGAFVKEIQGDFYNVVGLPVSTLCEILRDEFGYKE